MKNKLLETVKKYSMFSPGDRVVVGLSGGADSVCLASILNELKAELGISVSAAHINHCIRGDEADSDEQFVRDFCKRENIPLTVFRRDVPAEAAESGESIELAARHIRYECFNECAADKIATAHSASDRTETLLFNLSRGASLKGLCSIPPVRDNIVRPLISITRTEIEEYCELHGIEYITDSTNLTDEYTRNKLRLNVIPELKAINPSFEKNALRCIELLNDENAFIEGIARRLLERNLLTDGRLFIGELISEEECVYRRVVTAFLESRNITGYEYGHIGIITESKGNKFALCLPGNHRIESDGAYLYVKDITEAVKEALPVYSFSKNDGITFVYGGIQYSIYVSDKKEEGSGLFSADAGRIGEHLILRSRAAGDCIKPGRGRYTKSLRKLFNELKIPEEERELKYVLADEKGVAFVEGIGFDSSRFSSAGTEKFLIVKTEEV